MYRKDIIEKVGLRLGLEEYKTCRYLRCRIGWAERNRGDSNVFIE